MDRRTTISIVAALVLIVGNVRGQEDEPLSNDTVQLVDGRFVSGRPMTTTPDGVVVHYENGDVLIPKGMVKDAFTSEFKGVEQVLTEEDRARMADGDVKFEGAWMKPSRRDSLLARRAKERMGRLEEAQKHQKWRDRYIKETKNFEFNFTIDPEQMDKYAELMETYFKTFTREWGIRKPSGMGRLKVCFYHNSDYYHQVSGAQPGVIGYFRFVPPQELHFYYDRLDERMTVDVMFHEANHYLTHLIDPKFHYPPWVNESLAEYYGASEWDADKKKMSIGHIQAGRLTVVQDQIAGGEWQGLEDLIRLEHGSFNAVHYAWGWTFVHFLLETDKYSKNFKKLYLALAREKSIEKEAWNFGMRTVSADAQIEAIKKYLKVASLAELEKEWHEYIKGLAATGGRGYAEAGEQVLARGMPIKAQRYFKTAIEKGYTTPMTYYGLGRALYQKNKYDEALKAFEEAAKGDPLNASFYVYLARCKSMLTKNEKDPEVERLKKLAREIDPDNWDVFTDFSFGGD